MAVPNVRGQQFADAAATLRAAGLTGGPRRTGPCRTRTTTSSSLAQRPGGGRLEKGSTVTLVVGVFDDSQLDPDPTPTAEPTETAGADPDAQPVRVAVLSGGRSSEHDVSLASGAAVRAAVAEAGHEVLDVLLAPRRRLAARRRAGRPAPGRGAARRRRRLPRAARPLRRGRHGPGPARAARRPLRRRGRARLVAVHGQGRLQGGAGGGRRPAGRLRRGPPGRRPGASASRSACPRSSSPPARAPRSASSRCSRPSELPAALETAFGYDTLVIAEAMSARPRGRVRGARQRRPRGQRPRRDRR